VFTLYYINLHNMFRPLMVAILRIYLFWLITLISVADDPDDYLFLTRVGPRDTQTKEDLRRRDIPESLLYIHT
jgi:hypothetical protein